MQGANTYLLSIFLSVMLGTNSLYASTAIPEKVNSFPVGKKIVVKLQNGNRLKGKLLAKNADHFVLQSDTLLKSDDPIKEIRYTDVVEVEKAKSYKGWYIAGGILAGLTIVMAAVLGG